MAKPTSQPHAKSLVAIALLLVFALAYTVRAQESSFGALGKSLLAEPAAQLAADAQRAGDPRRGAVLFYQASLLCARCHAPDDDLSRIGPELSKWEKPPTGEELIEAILQPSKTVRKGFESATIETTDGQTITGLVLGDAADTILLADAGDGFRRRRIARSDIEAMATKAASIMPDGLVEQLASRQQFLDLIAYLASVAKDGPARAAELKPPAELIAARPLPEYESHLDHAGLIGELNDESYARGEAIFNRVCANCHGTREREGSLPASLKFASGKFKSGFDPYRLYQTLTRGFGLMPGQTWMAPSQKYDVIHYLREAYLKPHNPTQYAAVDADYLASLPQGDTRGPAPAAIEPWEAMDYGPSLIGTYQIPIEREGEENFAYKAIAVRLDQGPGGVSRGQSWAVFDHDTLRWAAAWQTAAGDEAQSRFIDWRGIHFNGEHQAHPHAIGEVVFQATGPGWANPRDGKFDDPRLVGRDGKRYGPLPREWGQYLGLYAHGQQTVVAYRVGDARVLECAGQTRDPAVFTRTLNVGPRSETLELLVANSPVAGGKMTRLDGESDSIAFGRGDDYLAVGIHPQTSGAEWRVDSETLRLQLPAGDEPLRFSLWIDYAASIADCRQLSAKVEIDSSARDLAPLTQGGPARWPQTLSSPIVHFSGDEKSSPFVAESLALPIDNPWLCQIRPTGIDFFEDGAAAVCTWDGDVWRIDEIAKASGSLGWRRIASGLFQPLGVRIVGGLVHVTCRDQLVVLHDSNGDLETDFYECLNNDHQVTEHFHEFAMGLQTDAEGNFYYAKSARHALPAIVPHHGTLLKVAADGSKTEILANGFRAANGVCLNSDGTFFVTDQEGHWNPKNRINWVRRGGFYGNMFGYHDVTDERDEAMSPPLCWITNSFDRSPGELLWVDSPAWAPLEGSLLELSYGTGKIFVVPHEKVNLKRAPELQGGLVALPIPNFPTGVMRGRFNHHDGQLYACGMFAWAGDRTEPGGLYRIRRTKSPLFVPVGLRATAKGMEIEFSCELDRRSALDAKNYTLRVWSLKRTANYGSEHFGEHGLKIQLAALSDDGRTVKLAIPDIAPTWCMSIAYSLRGANGEKVEGEINNTIHAVKDDR